ncbi:M-like protein [Deinococcus hohokamensis]|uniref:M-like protein n=1 Tax=Deinococcus hohokamensis TaxID=309883 RepID=A0ABV9I5W4_9DEIO
MTHDDDQRQSPKTEEEISNVDLQFMGRTDTRREMRAEEEAEATLPDEFNERGLDPQDVASNGSMITSDPASTHMPADDATSNEH